MKTFRDLNGINLSKIYEINYERAMKNVQIYANKSAGNFSVLSE